MSSKARVIINGDDFGMNERCSRAIAQAFGERRITDTTAMANGDYFDEAIAAAVRQGFADRIGIHFNLTEGVPLTTAVKSLPDFVSGGRFHKRFLTAPRSLGEAEQSAIYAELTAQAERFLRAGIRITHADSHHYIHNDPHLAPIIARVCRENGIRKIRLQRNIGEAAGDKTNNRFWKDSGFMTTDRFGRLSDIASAEIPDNLEIMVHPDFDKNGILIDRRGVENGFPVGDILRDLSAEHPIELFSYHEL